ncbi:hypothetical protein Acor_42900 [Acrocarpospora corrugata]|uniref:Uncharacterized protein n=1 Tax=Acrocarpospora corrugata TaxID=35763 RepID=A0A5M3VZH2_9ACTN|nr:CATRA conflict system CASPASE/TPR repeat-associated protein [Acrocarpospora corrugata]GES02225.1 hypothetical protein Acor_42900 [Acrocarpospora corrugata]
MTLTRHSLVVHLFTQHTDYPRLRTLWADCVHTFALTEPHPRPNIPTDPLADQNTLPATGPLAARHSPQNETQAVIRSHHDVLVLSLAFSPPEPHSPDAWADLETQWTRVAGNTTDWAIGETRLRLAYETTAPYGIDVGKPSRVGEDNPPSAGDNGPRSVGEAASSALDESGGTDEPSDAAEAVLAAVEENESSGTDAAAHGLYAVYREVGEPSDTRRLRTIEVVAPVAFGVESDHRTWSRRVEELPPFAAYLLAVAKVGYELRVHKPFDLRELRGQADNAVDRGLTALREIDEGPDAQVDPEVSLRLLTGVLAGPKGLTQRHTRLTEMRRTVEIAMSTMARHRDSEEGLFADDAELAAWFHQRLDDDLLYLGAARERVREVMPLLHVAAERALLEGKERLREKEAQSQKEQNNFNLAQAGFIGAVVMVLSAIQAFSYTVDAVPPSVHPAIISALGALALLSTLAAARILSARRALDRLVQGAAGLLGAALAWVALAWTHKAATGHPAPIVWTLAVSVAGFVIGATVTLLRHRRHRKAA